MGDEEFPGGAIRGQPDPPAGGGLPDARLAERGRRRSAGSLAAAQPLRHERRREPGRMADDSRRAGVPRHAALAQVAARGAARDRHRSPSPNPDGVDPEHEAVLADSVGLALLVVLETLTPAERLAFVLHDMFAVPFDEIAPIVGRSPAAARQLASRARRRVQRSAPTFPDAELAGNARSSTPSSPLARRRLRGAARGARPGRRAARRRRPRCRRERRPRFAAEARGGPGTHVREPCPVRAARAHQRRGRNGGGAAWTVAARADVHGRRPEGRRAGGDRRPGAPQSARAGRPRRMSSRVRDAPPTARFGCRVHVRFRRTWGMAVISETSGSKCSSG